MSEQISPVRILNELNEFYIEPEINDWFGESRKCYIKATGQSAIIKFPFKNDPDEIQALIKEYNLLVQCSHPSIQTVIGFYHPENSDKYCLITPFYRHGTLSDFMKERENDFGSILKFMVVLGITAGMKYLHKIGIVHGDLKPANILINEGNRPLIICNFGHLKQKIEAENLIYSAPEIFQNATHDEKSDVFSFGMIVNEIYSGKPQFVNPTIGDLIKAKEIENYEIDQSMPKFLKEIIVACLKKNPSDRPTFKKIFKKLKSNIYKMSNNALITSYIKEMKIWSKLKRFFQIPHQILKLPSDDFPWNRETSDPINWEEFKKIIPENNQKAILIMMIGNSQSGKSTFLRAITGNQAFFSGTGIRTTTIGLLIDGPYRRNDLLDNIFDDEFKGKFNDIEITDDTQIFFIDSQGIGDEHYFENYGIVLDRIHSLFCSVSTICISIPDINATYEDLQKVIKVMRRTQLISGASTKMLFLVKGYEEFDKLEDFDFDSISNFHKKFLVHYKEQYKKTSQYYINDYLTPLPLGNCKYNYENYIYSSWYALYNVLSKIKEEDLFSMANVNLILSSLTSNLFGQDYCNIYNEIVENPPENSSEIERYFSNSQKTTAEIIKCCNSCCLFLANNVSRYLELSLTIDQNIDDLFNEINRIISIVNQFILPFLLGEYNVSLSDFWQYSVELTADIDSFLKANSEEWQKHMKLENDASKAKKPLMITTGVVGFCVVPIIFLPFFLGGVSGGFSLFRKIQKTKRDKLRSSFHPTIYPYIWDRNITKVKKYEYKMNKIKQIGWSNDQLIIFYEQNNNDSSLLFRSLTGFDVNFKDQAQVSQIFYNVSIKSMMERFKRYGKIHTSRLEKQRVNILYLKGYSQENLIEVSHAHSKKPIFISCIVEGQCLQIIPEEDSLFHLFYISLDGYKFNIVKKAEFLKNMKSEWIEKISDDLQLKFGDILPIHSKDYNFIDAGPITNALIKYGCRFILQDVSLDIADQNAEVGT